MLESFESFEVASVVWVPSSRERVVVLSYMYPARLPKLWVE